MMYEWFELEIGVLTPAFIAGAEQKETEFRAASVRGLLRWWWRAAVGHECSVPELAMRESRLFGSTSEGLKSSVKVAVSEKSIIRMNRAERLPQTEHRYTYRRQGRPRSADILPYLAYGPVRLLTRAERHADGRAMDPIFNDRDGKAFRDPRLMRPAIAPGSQLQVRLSWPDGRLSRGQVDELARAACAWTTLGGIGSRSRKGWGLLEGSVISASSPDLLDRMRHAWAAYRADLLRNGQALPRMLPDFPQLAYRRIILDARSFGRWEQALGSIGLKYKALRPRGESRWIAGDADPRRASSLFISMTRESNGDLRGLLCLLPCRQSEREVGDAALRSFMSQLERQQGLR